MHRQPVHQMRLRDDHKILDRALEDLLVRSATGEWSECESIWDSFSDLLLQHMYIEEEELFPEFARSAPGGPEMVAGLRAEHEAIRRDLEVLGVGMQLHLARIEIISDLVNRLRDHARREDAAFYPWLAARRIRSVTAVEMGVTGG